MMDKLKVIFMGTPNFAISSLQVLLNEVNIIGIITQPDNCYKRNKIEFSPVKKFALQNNLSIIQPRNINNIVTINYIKNLNPDIIVVVAYGQILSQDILDIPKYGCINIHASLLPKYRGPAPINWAIINNEEKTGITIIKMNNKCDEGDILYQQEINIDNKEFSELYNELSVLGANSLLKVLNNINNIIPISQNNELASYAPFITKDICYINWNNSIYNIYNLIRGLNGNAYTFINNGRLKIHKAQISNINIFLHPGEIKIINKQLFVGTQDGILEILKIQKAGSKKLNINDFLNGHYFLRNYFE